MYKEFTAQEFRAHLPSLTETELLESFFHFNNIGSYEEADLAEEELSKRGIELTSDDYSDPDLDKEE